MQPAAGQLTGLRLGRYLLASLLLTLPALVSQAQKVTPAAYAGPRFPGGPDSLRAYLGRHRLRQTSEPVFVQFAIGPGSELKNIRLLTTPGRKAWGAPVVTEATRLVRAMPAWVPGRQNVETPVTTVTLGLNPAPQDLPAYAYADEMPVFANMEPGISGLYHYLPTVQVTTPAILQNKLTGDVYAYLEVSETGRLEHIRILDGAVPALNNAARQTVARLPQQAQKPAKLHGQPVRIYYVLSMGFESK
ncbi:MAG: energy transducer TonB [Janthinobacterium lividum]